MFFYGFLKRMRIPDLISLGVALINGYSVRNPIYGILLLTMFFALIYGKFFFMDEKEFKSYQWKSDGFFYAKLFGTIFAILIALHFEIMQINVFDYSNPYMMLILYVLSGFIFLVFSGLIIIGLS